MRGSDIEDPSTSPRSDETTPPDREQLQHDLTTPPVDGYQANSTSTMNGDLIIEEDVETDEESVEQEEPLLAALFRALLACFRKVNLMQPHTVISCVCIVLTIIMPRPFDIVTWAACTVLQQSMQS